MLEGTLEIIKFQTPCHVMLAWEGKLHNHKSPPILLLSRSRTSYDLEYPFGQLLSSVLAVSHPQSLVEGDRAGRKKENLDSCTIAKTVVSYQHCFS